MRAGAADPPGQSNLPPILASGAVSYSLQETSSAATGRTWRNSLTGTINPNTYIWEPWFATANGSVNLSVMNTSGGKSATNTGGGDSSNTLLLTGTMNINVLPESFFPAQLSYTRVDNSVQVNNEQTDSKSDSFSYAQQLFVWEDLDLGFQAQLDTSAQNNNSTQTTQTYNADALKRFETQAVKITMTHRNAAYESPTTGAVTGASNTLAFRHRYSPLENVSADSTSTLRQSGFNERTQKQDSLTMQGVTTLIYKPPELPLTVHGAFRTFDETQATTYSGESTVAGTTNSHIRTVFANAGATYILGPGLTSNANLSANVSQTQINQTSAGSNTGSNVMGLAGGVGLGYTAPTRDLYGFDWSWSGDAGADTSFSTADSMNVAQTSRLGHTALRMVQVPLLETLQLSASQNIGSNLGTDVGLTPSLANSATLSRNMRKGKDWDLLQLSASDSRTFMNAPVTYQLLSVQFTKGYEPDAFTSIMGSITFQSARQIVGESKTTLSTTKGSDSGWRDTTSGSLTFSARNIFGEPNLNFASEYSVSPPSYLAASNTPELSGSSASRTSKSLLGTQRWTNRLEYVIGRMRMRLINRLANADGGMVESTLFQITRTID